MGYMGYMLSGMHDDDDDELRIFDFERLVAAMKDTTRERRKK